MSNNSNNLQEIFLTQARRDRRMVTMFLMNGFQMRGYITGFDAFTVVLTSDGKQQIIYKHAISTIVPERPVPKTGYHLYNFRAGRRDRNLFRLLRLQRPGRALPHRPGLRLHRPRQRGGGGPCHPGGPGASGSERYSGGHPGGGRAGRQGPADCPGLSGPPGPGRPGRH